MLCGTRVLTRGRFGLLFGAMGFVALVRAAAAAETLPFYYAHAIVEDGLGVAAPWYSGQNGQIDYRIQRAAEVLLNSGWSVRKVGNGTSVTTPTCFWGEGDLDPGCVQRAARALFALVEYYHYSGDPAALGHAESIANTVLDLCQTAPDHPWPQFLMSVPYGGIGKDGKVTSAAYIQLDIAAEFGVALLRAYQLLGNERWLTAAQHWAEVLAEKRDHDPGARPWPRYANPEVVPWAKDNPAGNLQTGGVVYLLALFDELIKLGHTGRENGLVSAREAGMAYLRDVLLPAWAVNDTWGRNYWDWENPVQAQVTTDWAARYLMNHKEEFPNWRNDVRNILSLFLNHSSASPESRGNVYHGAWQFPEGCGCCGRSLAWGPMELALDFAQYGVEADSEWARELGRRMVLLATYDVDASGAYQDNIDGGVTVGDFPIVQYTTLKWVHRTMSWLPELLGPSRENHIMRSTEVVNTVQYGAGRVAYSVFAAPANTTDVLRLAFEPERVTADGEQLPSRSDLAENGYVAKALAGGDYLVTIRHDGRLRVEVTGNDPQAAVDDAQLAYEGEWTARPQEQTFEEGIHTTASRGARASCTFVGNQVRIVGSVGPEGGLADVYIDGEKQAYAIDFWNPRTLHQQLVYRKNGLTNTQHTVQLVARGEKNPLSAGAVVAVDSVQYSAAGHENDFGEGGGPTTVQRMIFGYTGRTDYRDTQGNLWRPGTEFAALTGHLTDTVAKTWWTTKQAVAVAGTQDGELYSYGVHWPEFVVNVTVGPGTYYVRLKFAETQYAQAGQRGITVEINKQPVVEDFDVFATAGGANKAVDLVFNGIEPRNGVIDIRFRGNVIESCPREAMVQAIEVGPGDGGRGAVRQSSPGG